MKLYMILLHALSDLCLFLYCCCTFNTFICKWTWLWYLYVSRWLSVFFCTGMAETEMINAYRFELLTSHHGPFSTFCPSNWVCAFMTDDSVTADYRRFFFVISDWFCHLLTIMTLRPHLVFSTIKKIRQK